MVIELIGTPTYAEFLPKALDLVSHLLNADAALYTWQDGFAVS